MVAFLLRLKLRRCANLHRAPVHRTAADTTLKPQDGYAVCAILPRSQTAGIAAHRVSRKGVGLFVVGVGKSRSPKVQGCNDYPEVTG